MTIYQYIEHHAAQSPTRLAVVSPQERCTYGQLHERILQRADSLAHCYSPGQVVCLRAQPTVDFLVSYYAIHRAGLVAAPLGSTIPDAAFSAAESRLASCSVPPGTADILFTTGTTGRSKGVIVSHRAMVANAENLVSGQGAGTFLVNITGLNSNTTYYMKAYAVNYRFRHGDRRRRRRSDGLRRSLIACRRIFSVGAERHVYYVVVCSGGGSLLLFSLRHPLKSFHLLFVIGLVRAVVLRGEDFLVDRLLAAEIAARFDVIGRRHSHFLVEEVFNELAGLLPRHVAVRDVAANKEVKAVWFLVNIPRKVRIPGRLRDRAARNYLRALESREPVTVIVAKSPVQLRLKIPDIAHL